MTPDEQAIETRALLEVAVDYFCESESVPINDFFKRYYLLTGEHMILTDEGWTEGSMKEEFIRDEYEILDEVNPPQP